MNGVGWTPSDPRDSLLGKWRASGSNANDKQRLDQAEQAANRAAQIGYKSGGLAGAAAELRKLAESKNFDLKSTDKILRSARDIGHANWAVGKQAQLKGLSGQDLDDEIKRLRMQGIGG